MNILLHILDVRKTLDPYVRIIERVFDESVVQITKKMPVDMVDVVVRDDKRKAIPELGFGGYSYSQYFIVLSVDGENSDCGSVIEEELPGVLAHELYHCIRRKHVGYGKTLLEVLITEGLASHFEEEMYGKVRPWTIALKDGELMKWLSRAKKKFDDTNYNHRAWFFGSKTENIPRWTGYSLGYYIVGEYLKKNSGEKASDLYDFPAGGFGF